MSAVSFSVACTAALVCGSSAVGCAPRVIGAGPASDGGASGSKCGSTPAQLVDFNALATQVGATSISATQLAVDSTSVYFVFGSALMRVPIRGGSASTMLPLLPDVGQNCDPIATPTSVLLHHVVGGATNDEQIISVPIQGGKDSIVATSSGFVSGLATDGHDVYFVDSVGLKSAAMTGGSVQLLADQIGSQATGLAVVGSNLVVTAGAAVMAVPIQGGPPTTLTPQQPNAEFPMACGPDTCWWTGASYSPSGGPTGPGYIARLASGSVTTISAPVYPWSLVFDGSNFFETVGCDLCSGTLVRIPPSGAPPVTMASAGFVAVDDECAYFSVLDGFDLPSGADGRIPASGIFSVAKSYADPALAEMSAGPGGAPVDSGGGCGSGVDAGSESEGGVACAAPCDGTCVGGRCLVTLASGQSNANGIAVDSTSVYWTEYPAGNVKKVSLDGGAVTTLASGQAGPLGIAVDSTSVYWTGESETGSFPNYTQTGAVTKAGLDGGSPITLASLQSDPNSVAVDSTSIYWTNGGTVMCDCGSIMKAALDGSSATTLASGRNLPQGIAIDSTSVYWTEGSGGTVMKVAIDGGSPTTLVSGPSQISGNAVNIAVDGTSAYWTNSGVGTVLKVPLAGGTPTTLASGQCTPAGIAIDSTSVYWTNSSENGNNGTVMKVALDGSGMTTLASGQSYPNSIAVDSTSVYWANLVGDTMMKLTPK